MSDIYVNMRKVRDANYDLPHLEEKADLLKRRTQSMKRKIPVYILNKYQIGERMDTVCKEIGKLETRIRKLHEVTNVCIEQYAYAEYENSRNAEAFL